MPLSAWDRDALAELRGAVYRREGVAVVAALEGSPLDDVLQLAGDGLVTARAQRVRCADALAARCAALLRERRLDGDAELADALEGSQEDDLRPLAVDLDELSSVLEGDPLLGGGRIDLRTGEIWHHSPYDDPVDVEDDDLDDDDRWLWVHAGSRDGWFDMDEFTATVADPALAERLQRAIHGRGAFRRFRDVLEDHPDELSRFHRFADEHQRGRARRWLADHGLRPLP
jgi:hypothetical protein